MEGNDSDGEPNQAAGTTAATYETVFTNQKAGMEGVDLARVKQVVYEMSKDSAHYANEQRKMAATERRIQGMKQKYESLTENQRDWYASTAATRIVELEATRDLSRTWIHVDMDAFFAAVEELDNPVLKGKPFAVGGIGMISTASYAARRYGVRSAMPGFIALKLCPELVFVSPDFEKYQKASMITRDVFQRYDPDFEAGSLDEAYLDVTEYCEIHKMIGEDVAAQIRAAVKEETGGLTCSCGIAPNKMLAKVCSDQNKPNGQFHLQPTRNSIMKFVSSLPVRKIPGVGRVTEHILKSFQVEVCQDILSHKGTLAALFSSISLDFFLQSALGLGSTSHSSSTSSPGDSSEIGRRGISCERTFRAISSRDALEIKVKELSERLAHDMSLEGLKGKTLTLKMKLSTFEVRTRATTLSRYIASANDIFQTAVHLLRAELPVELRLMGLRMSNFYEEPRRDAGQKSLDDIIKVYNQESTSHDTKEQPNSLDEEPHTSQTLSPGDMIELTLRDWQRDEDQLDKDFDGRSDGGQAGDWSDLEFHKKETKPLELWSCQACTFENAKGEAWCAMCGTSRSGRRPKEIDGRRKKNTATILDFCAVASKRPRTTRL